MPIEVPTSTEYKPVMPLQPWRVAFHKVKPDDIHNRHVASPAGDQLHQNTENSPCSRSQRGSLFYRRISEWHESIDHKLDRPVESDS